ncbi:MAG: helix-turn-helix transcriptional regulator [Firmicutes bacterium]|nr:helix-turn-helix transcriptional regulator [Bacillota bacterium]
MQNSINSDLIRGNIDTIILKALFEGDRYGKEIIKEIEERSAGQYVIKQPTLYSCLTRMEKQGLVRYYLGEKSAGGRKKYFALTDAGKDNFLSRKDEWDYSRVVLDRMISGKEVDISRLEDLTLANAYPKEGFDIKNEGDENSVVFFDTNAIKEEETIQQIDTSQDTEKIPPEPVEIVNTADLFQSLKEQEQLNNESYTEKVLSEDYVATPQKKPFDFDLLEGLIPERDEKSDNIDNSEIQADTQTTSAEEDEEYEDYSEIDREVASTANSTAKQLDEEFVSDMRKIDERWQEDAQSLFPPFQSKGDEPPYSRHKAQETAPPKSFQSESQFTAVPLRGEEQQIVERDYKDFLGQFVNFDIEEEVLVKEEAKEAPPPIKREHNISATLINEDISVRKESTTKTYPSLGEIEADDAIVRVHSPKDARIHTSKYYYYCNRLMLVQFGILFAVMIGMIGLTFGLSFAVGIGIHTPLDIWLYALAIALAGAFPITSAILHYKQPNKEKRIQFNLKIAMLYRLILMANTMIIVYLLNIFFGMRPNFQNGNTFFATLLLPSLLALCFPISTLIFNSLYESGKYSV